MQPYTRHMGCRREWQAECAALNDLLDLKVADRPRMKINPLLERSAKPRAIQCDDPALLDDHVVDHAPVSERRAADSRVLALGRAVGDEKRSPLFRQYFRQTISRRGF